MVTVQIMSPSLTHELYTKTNDDMRSSTTSLESVHSIPKNDDINKALQILDVKEWMNVEQFLNPWGADRVTLVHLAAYRGNLKMLERAVDLNADLLAVDKFGKCALHYAADKGHVDIVRWLLEHFAKVVGLNGTESSAHPQLSLPDVFGNTPLHEAIRGRHTSVVRLLVHAGSNVDAQNEKFHTPLVLAGVILEGIDSNEKSWYENAVEILVKALASVDVHDPITGATPLHYAVELNSCRATNWLLEAGARIDVKNKQGWTPLYTAAYGGHLKCVRLLVDNGGNLASESNNGETVVEALLKYGTRSVTLLTDILNTRVYAKEETDDVILDFEILAPRGEVQMAVISGLIKAVPTLKKLDILQHPLLDAFLRLKWPRYRYFYYLLLACQWSFVFLLVLYTLMLREIEFDPFYLRRPLLVFACIMILNNFMQIIVAPRHYKKKFEIWLSITCAIISAALALVGDYITEPITIDGIPVEESEDVNNLSWLLDLTGIIIPLSMVQVQMTVARHSEIGKYVLAFVNVFRKLLTVLIKCCSLIGSFSVGLILLFGGHNQLASIWITIKKIVGMVFGESDVTDILFTEDKIPRIDLLSDMIKAIFLILMALASIVLINLILSLVITDVNEFVKEGRNYQLQSQAEFLIYCERLTSGWIFRNRWMPNCLKKLLSKNMIDTRLELEWSKVYKNHPCKFSEKLLDELFDLGSKNSQLVKE